MRTLLKLWLVMLFILPAFSYAADNFPAQQNFAGQSLTLNGKGVRTKLLFTLYTAGLYLQEKRTDAAAILAAEKPMAMRLEILSSLITSEKMEEAVRDGFKQSSSDPNLQARIEQLIKVFKEPIKQGDIYDFVYRPGTLTIIKNGKNAASIPGADFKQAFFGIWLGNRPVQTSLKTALLGQ